MKTAIIGGGAAGFFLAVNLKERMPEMEVDIFERSQHVLAKVEISGGGRCKLYQLVSFGTRPLGCLSAWAQVDETALPCL